MPGLRLRLSVFLRALFALGVLGSVTLVLGVVLSVIFAGIVLVGYGWVARGYAALATAPRLSSVTPVPAVAVATLAGAFAITVLRGWDSIREHTGCGYLLPPTHPISAVALVGTLASLYLFVVEAPVAIAGLLSAAADAIGPITLLFVSGVALFVLVSVAEVRHELRKLRERLLADSTSADETHPELAATTRRLTQQVNAPVPEVRVTDTDRPESFTVGTGESAVIVVSEGLIEALSPSELEAVLAHEVSHLANADSRVMGAALTPVLIADHWIEDDPDEAGDYVWNAVFRGLKYYGQFGVAVLSRGREWSADAGAAALTGSPAALATALGELEDSRQRPRTDLRQWEGSIAAIDILPPVEAQYAGPFRTHPPTERRIERLQRLAARAERV